jgi:hypothetical protein
LVASGGKPVALKRVNPQFSIIPGKAVDLKANIVFGQGEGINAAS